MTLQKLEQHEIKEKLNDLNDWLSANDRKEILKNFPEVLNFQSPAKEDIFNALSLFKPEETRVLILGQDPYPNKDKATGFAFLQNNNKTDDSLSNILKTIKSLDDTLENILEEIENLKKPLDETSDENNETEYVNWVKNNKVLLLNTSLTYESKDKPHFKYWKDFIRQIITKLLTCNNDKLVVFLWGEKAKTAFHDVVYNNKISRNLLVLSTSHPSNQGFKYGFSYEAPNHFIVCNDFLGKDAVNWKSLLEIYPENN